MISYFLWMLKYVRNEILEKFILPELEISYWEFCIYLALVGIVATVLINSVRVSGGSAASFAKKEKVKAERKGKSNV